MLRTCIECGDEFEDFGHDGAELCEYCWQELEDEHNGVERHWQEPIYDKPNIAEAGICFKCGNSYEKTISESNISFTGMCFGCGCNP